MHKYSVQLISTDRNEFLSKILKWGAKGAVVNKEEVPRFGGIPYTCKLTLFTEQKIKAVGKMLEHTILPVHLIYSKQELDEMTITELQKVGDLYEVTGREKVKLVKEILVEQTAYVEREFPDTPSVVSKKETKQVVGAATKTSEAKDTVSVKADGKAQAKK